jgi:hypothetical protein
MAWIKRNLYFLIGSIIALALMIVGGVYLFNQISDEGSVADQIKSQYAELDRLVGLNPHPGDGTIDNIKLTKEQTATLRAYVNKAKPFYQRIAPIPESTSSNKITDHDFASQLRITVSQLQHSAAQQSVLLPQDYYFTFEAQKKIMNFDPASLDQLAVHLGEIKALCDLLFAAKVNSLDSIRREIISPNDDNPPDYLADKTVTTPLADLTPYEVTFRCFSTELAQVLANLASSTNAFLVKTINVEPAGSAVPDDQNNNPNGQPPPMSPMPMNPNGYRPPGAPGMPGIRGYNPGYNPNAPGAMPAPVAAPTTHGPQVVLNEHPLRVTLFIRIVKLKPTVK